jgi:glycosyltransferase involved in cell wall biosynthesis
LAGIPFSFTAHARDLVQVPKPILRHRIREATAVVTCCSANLDYLNRVASNHPHPPFHLVPHGVDLEVFQPSSNGTRLLDPPLILSAGRLVEKKGFLDLIQALYMISLGGQRFHCEIYGDGPLKEQLANLIQAYRLEDCVRLLGAYQQEQLAPALQRASLFVLTPRVSEDGDRDGIPNVIGEALACGVPVVSTCVAGIPELVEDHKNGLLYPPGEIEAIGEGVGILLNDEKTRQQMSISARQMVAERFDQRRGAEQLVQLFCG